MRMTVGVVCEEDGEVGILLAKVNGGGRRRRRVMKVDVERRFVGWCSDEGFRWRRR